MADNTPNAVDRDRALPIPIAALSLCGGLVGFALRDDQRIEFATPDDAPLHVLGLRLRPRGVIVCRVHSFEPQSIQIEAFDPVPADAGWFSERDFNEPYLVETRKAVERHVMALARRLAIENLDLMAAVLLEKIDDLVIDASQSVAHWLGEIDSKPSASYRDREIWRELMSTAARKLGGYDECARSHEAPFRARGGYVLVHLDRPLFKPTGWGHSSQGMIGRLLHSHHLDARRMQRDIGNFEASIQRIRIVDGEMWLVENTGLERPRWAVDDAVLTFAKESTTVEF